MSRSTEVVGPTTEELESFNELIQFDHVYYKPAAAPLAKQVTPSTGRKGASKPACKKAVSIIKPAVRAVTQSQPASVATTVKEEPIEELTFEEADLVGLSQTLEELIDLDTILQEDLKSENQEPSTTAPGDTVVNSFTSVDKPVSRKRKHSETQDMKANK